MALGKQVRIYRTGLGWTLERLSEESQVDTGTISALEKRDSSRSQYGPALAKALGLTLEQLLDESTDYTKALLSGTLAAQAATRGHAHVSPSQITPWPFKKVSHREWRGLSEQEQNLVEAYIRGLVDASSTPRKSRKTGTTG